MPFPDERGERDVQLIGLTSGEGLERWDIEDLDGGRAVGNDKDVSVWNRD